MLGYTDHMIVSGVVAGLAAPGVTARTDTRRAGTPLRPPGRETAVNGRFVWKPLDTDSTKCKQVVTVVTGLTGGERS